MNWKNYVEGLFREYNKKIDANKRLKEKIKEMDEKLSSQKLSNLTGTPTGKDCSKTEDIWLNLICEKEEIKETIWANERENKIVDEALHTISKEEKALMECLYFEKASIEEIKEKFHIDTSTVYRRRNEVFKKIVLNLFGRLYV